MIDEQLEFQIAQYADGTLPAADAVALERVLATDAGARTLLNEYRRLDATLKRELPLPAINWDKLAGQLSNAVAEENRATTTIAWPLRSWGKVAMAASIALVIGLMAWWQLKPATPTSEIAINNGTTTTTSSSTGVNPTAVAIVEITGPTAQAASQPAVAQIEIGPSPWAKQTNFGVADQVVYRQARVLIASGQLDRQDTGRLPF